MPEFAGRETCLEALPSFQSLGSTASADAPSLTLGYCPSALLQAGAVLAVQLAGTSRACAEQDQFQTNGSVPGQDEIVDPGPAPEGCAAGAGPETAGTFTTGVRSDEISLIGTGNLVPNPNGQAASSLSKLEPLALTGGYTQDTMETDTDTGIEPGTDRDCLSRSSVSPPRKRRRCEDKTVPVETQHQHVTMAPMQEPVEIHPLLFSADLNPTVKLFPLLNPPVEKLTQSVARIPNTEESFSASKAITPINALGTRLSTLSALGLVPERTPFDFFNLPGEIRNLIYKISLHWPNRKELYASWYTLSYEHRRWEMCHPDEPERPFPIYTPRFRAPTILLLCKRITSECIGILRARTLVIDRLPPWRPGDPNPLPITSFIPKTTFQAIRRLEVKIPLGLSSCGSGYVWAPIVCDLFNMLREKNSFELLRVVFVIHYSPGNGAWRTSEQRHLEQIDHALVKLERENRNLKWPCTLERVYWIIEGNRASRAHTNSSGELHPSDEEVRPYPDNDIYPSSIFEAT
ncbi:hypothetical protein V8F33_006591 [Rhypophila sp. PSN 637]